MTLPDLPISWFKHIRKFNTILYLESVTPFAPSFPLQASSGGYDCRIAYLWAGRQLRSFHSVNTKWQQAVFHIQCMALDCKCRSFQFLTLSRGSTPIAIDKDNWLTESSTFCTALSRNSTDDKRRRKIAACEQRVLLWLLSIQLLMSSINCRYLEQTKIQQKAYQANPNNNYCSAYAIIGARLYCQRLTHAEKGCKDPVKI